MRHMRLVFGASMSAFVVAGVASSLVGGGSPPVQAQTPPPLGFFITSEGKGDGANLGGLRGADQHCAILAARVGGRPSTIWRAYLSTANRPNIAGVQARDRVGPGPWYNAKGVMIAKSPDDLHSDKNNLTKETQLTEKGGLVNGRGDTPNTHDILTGSGMDGRLPMGTGDMTCNNWTSAAGDGSAMVGHHDRQGGGQNPTSWNSAHASKGCSQANLQATGGNALFYCFATN